MSLAHAMLLNDDREDDLREYALKLLQNIRKKYPKDWAEDWRNDVFLGDACYLTMDFEERYKAYKRAFDKVKIPPPSLMISLASCYTMSNSSISLDDAEVLAKKALEQELSIEGVVLLRGIYAKKRIQLNLIIGIKFLLMWKRRIFMLRVLGLIFQMYKSCFLIAGTLHYSGPHLFLDTYRQLKK